MSTMTTATRGTPSLSIAATQNTAPVHEFRCMFSHDLRKKKKTWHDGSVRFHTFNKRVMVYDDVKNFIGDLHYRVTDDFGEGTELQLDKGILVQVEDRIGQTETDLAPLLDKRRPEDGATASTNHHVPSTHSIARTLPAYSHGRPRSLADVLGASQGPLGRARLPLRSPYEQRNHIPTIGPTEEPPLKRQRIATGKENGREVEKTPFIADVIKEKRHNPEQLLHRRSPLIEEPKGTEPFEVVDLSSDEEPVRSKAPPARVVAYESSRKTKAKTTRDAVSDSRTVPKPPRSKTDRNGMPDPSPRPSRDAPPLKAVISVNDPRIRPSIPGKTQLHFGKEKSRPKLMYRALLPPTAQISAAKTAQLARQNEFGNPSQRSMSPKSARPAGQPETAPKSSSHVFDLDDIGELEAENLPADATNHATASPAKTRLQSASNLSSPLFCPPSSAENRLEELGSCSQNDLVIPSSMEEVFQHSEQPQQPSAATMVPEVRDVVGEGDNATLEKAAAPDKLTLLDRRLMMPPPPLVGVVPDRLQESSLPRPFRRVLSESDSPAGKDTEHEAPSKLPTALESMRAKQIGDIRGGLAYKSPSKLRRSISDTSGMVSPTKDAVQPAFGESIQESGPWTAMEAYLLFDWWPPGREKPRYSVNGQGQTDDGHILRGALRDEANAL